MYTNSYVNPPPGQRYTLTVYRTLYNSFPAFFDKDPEPASEARTRLRTQLTKPDITPAQQHKTYQARYGLFATYQSNTNKASSACSLFLNPYSRMS